MKAYSLGQLINKERIVGLFTPVRIIFATLDGINRRKSDERKESEKQSISGY